MSASSDTFCMRMEAAAQAAEAEVRAQLWKRTAAAIRRTFEAELDAEQVRLENEAVIARARYNAMENMKEKMRKETYRKTRDIESKLVESPHDENLSSNSSCDEKENIKMKQEIEIQKMEIRKTNMEIAKSGRDSHILENGNVMTIVQMKEEVEIRNTEMKIEIQRRKKEAKIRRMEMEEEISRRKRNVENSRRKMKRQEENSRGNKEVANSEREKEEGSNSIEIEEEIEERETEIQEENEDKRKIENQEKRKIEEVSKIKEEKLSEETVGSNVEKCQQEADENKEAEKKSSNRKEANHAEEERRKADRPYNYRDQYREKQKRPPRKSTSVDRGLRPGHRVLDRPWSPNSNACKNDRTVKNPNFKPSKTELRNKCHHRKKMRGSVRSVQRHSFCCGPGRVRFARDRTSSRHEISVIRSVNKIKIGRS